MQMEINELYRKLREEGRGVGHAQWCVGLRCLRGNEVKRDLNKAEEWFLKAWDHHFPGTANTQAFVLRRQWEKFITETYHEVPRMATLLTEANTLSDEQHATILIPVHNVSQKEWLDSRIEEVAAAFRQFTNKRFLSISIFANVR
jgi:hypothetical protein